jgi:flagellar hook-length control protein FliK
VPLEHAHRSVEAALQLAAQRSGVTRARLHLHPAELGAIEIHLRHSASGVSARLVAESPEALTMLQQHGSDLRKSLEAAGIDVLGLDIGARGEERRADQGAFAGAAGGGSSPPQPATSSSASSPARRIMTRPAAGATAPSW